MATSPKAEIDVSTLSTTKKDRKMATSPKAEIDVSTLSYAELTKIISNAQSVLNSKRKSELKAIVDTFVESLKEHGFSKAEGLEALGTGATRAITPRPKSGTKTSKHSGPQPKWGATYKNPATGETWTKSATGKGGLKKWLKDLIDSGKTFEELEVV